jgi:transposase
VELQAWALALAPGRRRFGVESAGGIAYALARLLVAGGEEVCDVRGALSERERGRLRGQGESDARDALAIARVTAREQLPRLHLALAARDLKLLCDWRRQLLAERTRIANRLHTDLVALRPGYERALPRLTCASHLEAAERLLAGDESVQAMLARRRIETLQRLDDDLKQVKADLRVRVQASGSSLPELVGVSYLIAARIIGEVGDVRRIASKSCFARMNGTAPIPASSGKTQRHRLNPGGNRRLNHALHMIALTQARMDPRARSYVARKRSEGHSQRDAVRALKRHLSNVVYAQLRQDALVAREAG